MQAIFETLFDIVYLISVITIGITMVIRSNGNRQYRLFGIMAIILGAGDAFHLVPRAVALCTTGLADYTAVLGAGKLVTSITMTIFYVILYFAHKTLGSVHLRRFAGVSTAISPLLFWDC